MGNVFKSRNRAFEHLKKKWSAYHKNITHSILDTHLKKLAVSSLGGLMLLTTPALPLPSHALHADSRSKITGEEDKNALLKLELLDKVPEDVRQLSKDEEAKILEVLNRDLAVKATAEMEGIRLNRNYGLIGGEQHLYRYPGDNIYAHARNAQDWAMYGSSGIAPGLGAWGYFAPSKQEFTPKDEERERFYLAIQTFLVPGFSENVGKYRDFFKYRKMIVVNPKTGQAVVAVIGDAGPAEWTGKHLGGSPEVMQEIGWASGPRKGPVLYFFIDDPNDEVPLGPIKIIDNIQIAKG